ncbi:hypothetical protein [Catenulispora acidiphila]|uniref:hypothetical protein n=1 Tax=Catenulispora acidiphila TaxID=304895 RepID=UPI00059F25A7|nr:hypothetical protein [Catenulispora acidiphila]
MSRIVSSRAAAALSAASEESDAPAAVDGASDAVLAAVLGAVTLADVPPAVGVPSVAPFDVLLLQAARLATNDAATAAVAMRERIIVPLPNEQAVTCMTPGGWEGCLI